MVVVDIRTGKSYVIHFFPKYTSLMQKMFPFDDVIMGPSCCPAATGLAWNPGTGSDWCSFIAYVP